MKLVLTGTALLKNRNRHGGGVLLYVKDGIDYSEMTELASEQVESVWIKLMYNKEMLMLGMVYRPPSSNNNDFNCVLTQIDHVHSLNENIILMGDLNYNYKFDESIAAINCTKSRCYKTCGS